MEVLHESLYEMSGKHYQIIYDETDIDVPELFDMDEQELYNLYETLCEIEDAAREAGNTDGERYKLVYETVRIMGAALSGESVKKHELGEEIMKNNYPVVTLCGSTRFKDEFMKVQKELTLQGYIVISVGLFGHSGDNEVWERMDEGTKTKTKLMLDDMHKSKIDMANEVYVVNPSRYIGESTWSEICYAKMVGKQIQFMEPISDDEIERKVSQHIRAAEELAKQQLDAAQHQGEYFDYSNAVTLPFKRKEVLDPWLREDVQDGAWAWEEHRNPEVGVDPFEYYGKNKTARFIETILMKRGKSI